MHAKFFHRLPAALHRYVDTFLNSSDSAAHERTSSDFHLLSEHPPLPLSQRKILKKFLGHVVHGEREPMHEMLQKNSQLMLQRDTVTDYSGRTFDAISGFEYALWALDKHLWEDMLAFLSRDEQGHLTEDGRKLVTQLLHQLEQVTDQQITYMLNGRLIKESHYDFSIISALHEYMNTYNAPRKNNWDVNDKQWREGVGSAQRLLPLHVVDEYCSDTSFEPAPQFDSRPRPANNLRRFRNWKTDEWVSWFAPNPNLELGVHFAVYKGPPKLATHLATGPGLNYGRCDFDAMESLYATRTQDFILLEAQLNSLLDVEEQPCPGEYLRP